MECAGFLLGISASLEYLPKIGIEFFGNIEARLAGGSAASRCGVIITLPYAPE